MAEQLEVEGVRVKVRSLWVCALLLLVTIGIYYLFWYYMIKRELRDFGARRGVQDLSRISPGMGVLAMTLGWYIIVPPFVSAWRTVRHVKLAQEAAGVQPHEGVNHTLGFLMFIVGFALLPIEVFYIQSHMNRLWRHARLEVDKAAAGMRGFAPA
ncbi:MAG TPA: DUF4234 domain-containing protein [Gaiellaceae bacterium]|jgi:hypothetical protein|nr:DUF4234 domain-containing protein [Gaiellaceae bacterium]